MHSGTDILRNEIIELLNEINDELELITIKDFVNTKKNKRESLIGKKTKKCEMLQAKNFSLIYNSNNDNFKNQIIENCKNKHKLSKIDVINLKDKLVVTINDQNKNRFSKNTKMYDIEGIHPIITTDKVNNYLETDVNIDFSDKFIDQTILVNFDLKLFIESKYFNSSSLIKTFELYILNIIKSIDILIPSEYMLSSLLFFLIVNASKQIKNKRFIIIGLDSKIEEQYEELKFHYRIDTCFLYDDNVFIFEYKFRSDRDSLVINKAEETIRDRYYGIRLLNFLEKKNISGINKLINVGISYATGSNTSCSVTVNETILNYFFLKTERDRLKVFYNNKILEKSALVKYRFLKAKDIKLLPDVFIYDKIIKEYSIFVILLAKKLDGFVLIKNNTFFYFQLNNVIYMQHCIKTFKPKYICIHYNPEEMKNNNIVEELKLLYVLKNVSNFKQFNDSNLLPPSGVFELKSQS